MSYTITIRADDADAVTTVKVDDSGAEPRVTEVSVRATAGTGLFTPQLPAIDPDLLLRAMAPRTPTTAAGQATEAAPTPVPAPSADVRAAAGEAATPVKTGRAPSRPRAKSTAKSAPRQKARSRARKGGVKAATASTLESARIYRRTPDDLAATYTRIGNISAVARHYGVPRHTAQGWIARLRQKG